MMFVDTEAFIEQVTPTEQRHTLRLGVVKYVRRRVEKGRTWNQEETGYFRTISEFWDFVERHVYEGTKLYLFAHNWNYDAGILATATAPRLRGWKCVRYVNERPPFIVSLRRNRCTILLLDTLNYFGQALAAIGESIGLAKEEMPDVEADPELWWKYCERDVDIIKDLVLSYIDFIGANDLGNFQPTLASQAFTAYRHRFMPTDIFIHDRDRISLLERDAYHGGRSECFFLGKIRASLYYLDINSLYPFVMRGHPYPVKLIQNIKKPTIGQLDKALKNHAVVARVKIKTDEPVYSIRWNGKLVFPTGTFWTALTTPELQYARAHKHLRSIEVMAVYEQAYLFRDWVDEMYALRRRFDQESNHQWAFMVKYLLNSLYGKFGQNGQVWQETGEHTTEQWERWVEQETPDSPIRQYRVRLGVVQYQKPMGETENSFPAIAAHVTAYGRMELWQHIQKAGAGNVYYTDTDSLITNSRGLRNLVDALSKTRLGALKLENQAEECEFWGAKDYRFGRTIRHKGIKKNARQLARNLFEQEQFYSWDYLMSRGIDGEIKVVTIRKLLRRNYDKGRRTKSGWVEPLTFG